MLPFVLSLPLCVYIIGISLFFYKKSHSYTHFLNSESILILSIIFFISLTLVAKKGREKKQLPHSAHSHTHTAVKVFMLCVFKKSNNTMAEGKASEMKNLATSKFY